MAVPDSSLPASDHALSGKIALVTGGGRGIGEAICRRLAARSVHVIVAA